MTTNKMKKKISQIEIESKTTPSKSIESLSGLQSIDKSSEQSNSIYVPSKSESQSYRDKIRKRFKLIKEHAGSSLVKTQTLDVHKSIKLLKEENKEIEKSLEQRAQRYSEYSRTDCYHFFCEENADTHNNESCELQPDEEDEIKKFAKENSDNGLVEYIAPDILQDFLDLALKDSLWYPIRETNPTYEKLKNEIRLLSEEGFYVLEQTNIPNITLLERRLSTDDGKWFNCEGNLKLTEFPMSGHSYRPILPSINELPTEFVIPKNSSIPETLSSVYVNKPAIIEIHVEEVKFQHHPLFSIEHVFERKLLYLFGKYKEKTVNNKLDRINRKLEFLRKKTLDCGDAEITNHFREIKKLREFQIQESIEYRQLLKEILQAWKMIKKIRKTKGFSNTAIKLAIYKEKHNYQEEVEELEIKINTITSEMIREKMEDYQTNLEVYREELEIWNADKSLKKPKKPHNDINEEEIRENVAKEIIDAFKPPGEPTITFGIEFANEITTQIDNELETSRRQTVRSTKLYLKILFNGIDVCKTKQIAINDTFTTIVDETFSLQIEEVPQNITVRIYEQPSTMMKRKIADINVEIPSTKSHRTKPLFEKFQKEEIIHYNHDGIGSGCNIEELYKAYNVPNAPTEILNTCGYLNYQVSWIKYHDKSIDMEDSVSMKMQHILNDDGRINVEKLRQWTSKADIDPQNPSNTFLYDYIDACKNDESIPESPKKYFRRYSDLDRLIFHKPSKVEENIRFQILQLRNKNEPEFVGMIVPNRLKEIPTNILSNYQKRLKQEQRRCALEDDAELGIDEKRSSSQKYLQQIHIKVFQQCRSMPNNLTYNDIVNERLLSYFQNWIKTLVINFFNWFKIRPDISKPLPQLAIPKEDSIPEPSNAISSKLFVHVVSAVNIPNKISVKKSMKSRASTETISIQQQNAHVEVNYEDMSLVTSSQEGTNPIWKEKMVFPLRTTNIDYMSPNALNGSITLNLFVDIMDKQGEKQVSNWLGYIRIPLAAVVHSGKMEGSFQLRSPVFLNYEQNLIYVTLKLKVEPSFPKLSINMRELPCSEPPYLQNYLYEWNETYNESYPQNKFSVLAIDSSGKTICLTRFIRALEPPQMNASNFEVTHEQCMRYVSLIPFTNCNKLYDNIWLTTQEMLKLMTGSTIDHSIALTCFFLALNTEAWLLLGYGIPHGVTGYVLVREYDGTIPIHIIYDPFTANKYNITDPLSPLQKVFCVINEYNIWGNIQRTQDLNLLQFDFMRRSDWHSLFNNNISAPSNSMQHKLNYISANTLMNDLEFHIEKKLRKKILRLRRTVKTTWNHYVSNQLKNYITNIENNYTSNKYDISHIGGIEHGESVHGFIVDLPYTNMSTIFEVVKNSQVFNIDLPDKEYLFGIHVHMYPNQVLVVWMIAGFVLSK